MKQLIALVPKPKWPESQGFKPSVYSCVIVIAALILQLATPWAAGQARATGNTWKGLDTGIDGNTNAIAVSGSDVYIGGFFTKPGSPVDYIGKWDGRSLTSLGDGVDGGVQEIAVSGQDIYVGGRFTTAGGQSANHIAKWDGTRMQWESLGDGVDKQIWAIAVDGPDVYVGGFFSEAGGEPANHIAMWDGTQWHSLGDGVSAEGNPMGSSVYSIKVHGNDIYVGGVFTKAGDVPANNIARWNTVDQKWYSLDEGVSLDPNENNCIVFSIALVDSGIPDEPDVYAAGMFNKAGEKSANNIAKWNQAYGWQSLGSGLNLLATDLAIIGNSVYATGSFTAAGGGLAIGIARWSIDDSSWYSLGAGLNAGDGIGFGIKLAVSGDDLYVTGGFDTAGYVPAKYVAKWTEDDVTEPEITVPRPPTGVIAVPGNRKAIVTFTPPTNDGGSRIIRYTVTSDHGDSIETETAGPITINGLINGTPYRFTVTATNEVGTSFPSEPSAPVTPTAPPPTTAPPAPVSAPTTVPDAPTGASAVAGNGEAIVSFTPPENNGGNLITKYTVTSSPEGITAEGTDSPITVKGLTNGTAYTFTVTATNGNGDSAASAPTAPVTPNEPKRHKAYMVGYPDGSFRADSGITRAEIAIILFRLFGNEQEAPGLTFTDVGPDHWAKSAIDLISGLGLVKGYPDGTFKPGEKISPDELAAISARLTAKFGDSLDKEAIKAVMAKYADGSYRANMIVTRADVVTLINTLLGRGPLIGAEHIWKDVPTWHWAYGNIQEASVDHTYKLDPEGREQWIPADVDQ